MSKNTHVPLSELIRFRLFQMPCCGHSLCWVNPRKPTYCPECGKHIFIALKSTEPVLDQTCTLKSTGYKPSDVGFA